MINLVQFIYFGGQCPWKEWMIEQIISSTEILGIKYELIDLMEYPEYAEKYELFFPFTTIFDNSLKIPSPISAGEIIKITKDGYNIQTRISSNTRKKGKAEKISTLTIENIQDSCLICNASINPGYCFSKTNWALKINQLVPNNILGFISYNNEETAAVVEFLPSILVPYPIPKKEKSNLFITCIYSSFFQGPDYRGEILEKATEYLSENNFDRISVISGVNGAFPNGPKDFFIDYGFSVKKELGEVYLKEGIDNLIFMEKKIK